jgi:hypothetical protein
LVVQKVHFLGSALCLIPTKTITLKNFFEKVSSRHPLDRKILRNTKTTVLRNVGNHLRISLYSGTAKNLRDPLFVEKPEIFGKIGRFEE